MAGTNRNAAADLIERLQTTAPSSSFFQIVRLFRRIAARGGRRSREAPSSPVKGEAVRFRAAVGMRHPTTEIVNAGLRPTDGVPELTVSFMGLTGPMGVLPDYYTELLVEQRQGRNSAASDFLDLFNHRTIDLFYRAWAKYRLPIRYEETARPLEDSHSRALASLIGMGLDSSRTHLAGDGGDLLSVAGLIARRVRSAEGLRRALGALYDLPMSVVELQGRWIAIDPSEQTRLDARAESGGYAALGQTAVVGTQVWDVQSRFRIRIGPLNLAAFRQFLDDNSYRRALVDVVRLSVGPAVEFDLQLILRREDVPSLRLDDADAPALLGQTSWMVSHPPERDRDDAILDARWRPLERRARNTAPTPDAQASEAPEPDDAPEDLEAAASG